MRPEGLAGTDVEVGNGVNQHLPGVPLLQEAEELGADLLPFLDGEPCVKQEKTASSPDRKVRWCLGCPDLHTIQPCKLLFRTVMYG